MAVLYRFRCDTCGLEEDGEWKGPYVHPLPPHGWQWKYGPGLDGPHVCSDECRKPHERVEDGRFRLWSSHREDDEWAKVHAAMMRPRERLPADTPRIVRTKDTSRVYFIQRGNDGPVKIGHSKHPERRLTGLQSASPDPLRLLGTLPGGKAREAELHQKYAAFRLTGEWFKPEVARELRL